MRYLILGSGKTGGEVVKLLPKDSIVHICNAENLLTEDYLRNVDCVIAFVVGEVFERYIPMLSRSSVPVVSGVTGFDYSNSLSQILKAPWIIGSNFSIGMNMMFYLVRKMDNFIAEFVEQTKIKEVHHIHKKDKPSGTALRLKDILAKHTIDIEAKRDGDVIGEHELILTLEGELLSLKHEGLDRKIYARGAIWASQQLHDLHPGLHTFEDIMKLHLIKDVST